MCPVLLCPSAMTSLLRALMQGPVALKEECRKCCKESDRWGVRELLPASHLELLGVLAAIMGTSLGLGWAFGSTIDRAAAGALLVGMLSGLVVVRLVNLAYRDCLKWCKSFGDSVSRRSSLLVNAGVLEPSTPSGRGQSARLLPSGTLGSDNALREERGTRSTGLSLDERLQRPQVEHGNRRSHSVDERLPTRQAELGTRSMSLDERLRMLEDGSMSFDERLRREEEADADEVTTTSKIAANPVASKFVNHFRSGSSRRSRSASMASGSDAAAAAQAAALSLGPNSPGGSSATLSPNGEHSSLQGEALAVGEYAYRWRIETLQEHSKKLELQNEKLNEKLDAQNKQLEKQNEKLGEALNKLNKLSETVVDNYQRDVRDNHEHRERLATLRWALFTQFYVQFFIICLLWVLSSVSDQLGSVGDDACHMRKFSLFNPLRYLQDAWRCIAGFVSNTGQLVFSVGSTFIIFPVCRIFSLPNYVAILSVITVNTALLWDVILVQTYVDRPWQLWTVVSELAFLLHVWWLKRTWPTWRESDACCGDPPDEVRDGPYLLRWLILAVPSFAIACLAAVQPTVASNLHFFSIVPIIGHPIANIARFRGWIEDDWHTWIYMEALDPAMRHDPDMRNGSLAPVPE